MEPENHGVVKEKLSSKGLYLNHVGVFPDVIISRACFRFGSEETTAPFAAQGLHAQFTAGGARMVGARTCRRCRQTSIVRKKAGLWDLGHLSMSINIFYMIYISLYVYIYHMFLSLSCPHVHVGVGMPLGDLETAMRIFF